MYRLAVTRLCSRPLAIRRIGCARDEALLIVDACESAAQYNRSAGLPGAAAPTLAEFTVL